MKAKIVGIILIATMLAGFVSVVGHMTNRAFAQTVFELAAKGLKDKGSIHAEYQDGSGCKKVITPSENIHGNSKC